MQYQDLDTILSRTNRVPFKNKDLSVLEEYMNDSKEKGYDISLDSIFGDDRASFQDAFDSGFIILLSVKLDTRFLFINASEGKGLFRRQRRKVMSFIGSPMALMFTPDNASNKFIIALTGINTLFSEKMA